MKKESKKTVIFLRSFALTSVILFCAIFGFWGATLVFENTLRIGYGQYRSAIEITDKMLRIFDFFMFWG